MFLHISVCFNLSSIFRKISIIIDRQYLLTVYFLCGVVLYALVGNSSDFVINPNYFFDCSLYFKEQTPVQACAYVNDNRSAVFDCCEPCVRLYKCIHTNQSDVSTYLNHRRSAGNNAFVGAEPVFLNLENAIQVLKCNSHIFFVFSHKCKHSFVYGLRIAQKVLFDKLCLFPLRCI